MRPLHSVSARSSLYALVAVVALVADSAAQKQFAERGLRRYLPLLGEAYDIEFADIDGDGDQDLIPMCEARLCVLVNDGNGAFADESAARVPPAPGFLRGIAAGDLDGDGDVDLTTGNRLYENDGQGFFTDRTATLLPPVPASVESGGDVELGDLDGDGDLDLIFTPFLDSGTFLFVNTGGGLFEDRSATNWPGVPLYSNLELGDVDGDEDLDVLSSPIGSLLFENDGSGVFTDVTAQKLPPFPGGAIREQFLDADGDGDLDVLLAVHSPRDVLWLNDGQGTYTEAQGALPATAVLGGDCAVGDIDGDGDPDVVRPIRFSPTRLYENDGTGIFEDVSSQIPPTVYGGDLQLAFEDVDADGDQDLYLASNQLLLNEGPGVFYEALTRRLEYSTAVVMAAADLSGDGEQDVIVGGGSIPGAIWPSSVHFGNGPGAVYTKREIGADNTFALALGDVDGDSDVDVVEGNSTYVDSFGAFPHSNRLLLNDGAGNLAASAGLPPDTDDTKAVLLLDVENDGDLDLISGNRFQRNRVYLNGGHGDFVLDPFRLPNLSAPTYGLASGDVNGDGYQDVVAAIDNGQSRLYMNFVTVFEDGTAVRMPPDSAFSRDAELADLDGDGDLDMVLPDRGTLSQSSALYLNDGLGKFEDASDRIPGSGRSLALTLADLEEDGDLDIVFGRSSGSSTKLFLNEGNATFSNGDARLPSIQVGDVTSVLATDLDRDGDLELVLASSFKGPVILVNLHRQLDAGLYPILGRDYELAVDAEPGYATAQKFAAIAIAFELFAPPLQVPPYGTFFLAGELLTFPLVTIPMAQGSAKVETPVPNDPALLGFPFWGQAVIFGGGKARLTGYVADAIRL